MYFLTGMSVPSDFSPEIMPSNKKWILNCKLLLLHRFATGHFKMSMHIFLIFSLKIKILFILLKMKTISKKCAIDLFHLTFTEFLWPGIFLQYNFFETFLAGIVIFPTKNNHATSFVYKQKN